jgi:hypothetical protein
MHTCAWRRRKGRLSSSHGHVSLALPSASSPSHSKTCSQKVVVRNAPVTSNVAEARRSDERPAPPPAGERTSSTVLFPQRRRESSATSVSSLPASTAHSSTRSPLTDSFARSPPSAMAQPAGTETVACDGSCSPREYPAGGNTIDGQSLSRPEPTSAGSWPTTTHATKKRVAHQVPPFRGMAPRTPLFVERRSGL